jgi:hypothetical protein
MKITSVFAGSVGMLALAATASASPYLGISLDQVDNGGLIAGDTYRMYVDLDSGARVDAVFGNAANTLNIDVDGGSFVQSGFGGATSQDINESFFPFFPSLQWDSFVTIGLLSNTDNALNNIGIDWTSFESGGPLTTDNGSWFVTPNDVQGAEVGGRVLIGQFTITSGASLIGSVNVQGKDADGVTFQALNISWVPAPGALALLGVAGIAGRRRRR